MLHNKFCEQKKNVRNYFFRKTFFFVFEIFSFAKQSETKFCSFNFVKQLKLGESVSVLHHFRVSRKQKILTKLSTLISRRLIYVFILKHWLLYYTRIEMNRSYLRNFTKINICVYFETLKHWLLYIRKSK